MRPKSITYHTRSKTLELGHEGTTHSIPAELLRVFSPSAEVRGHAPGEQKLQTGKKHVGITKIEPVGNYAIKIVFDDLHDSGIYTWDYLYELGETQDGLWRAYLEKLEQAGASRDP